MAANWQVYTDYDTAKGVTKGAYHEKLENLTITCYTGKLLLLL